MKAIKILRNKRENKRRDLLASSIYTAARFSLGSCICRRYLEEERYYRRRSPSSIARCASVLTMLGRIDRIECIESIEGLMCMLGFIHERAMILRSSLYRVQSLTHKCCHRSLHNNAHQGLTKFGVHCIWLHSRRSRTRSLSLSCIETFGYVSRSNANMRRLCAFSAPSVSRLSSSINSLCFVYVILSNTISTSKHATYHGRSILRARLGTSESRRNSVFTYHQSPIVSATKRIHRTMYGFHLFLTIRSKPGAVLR